MRTWFTRAIQRRHGHKPVPAICPECGLARPSLERFPGSNIVGFAAAAWLASGRPRIFSTGIRCPVCGRPMTIEDDTRRRRRRRSDPSLYWQRRRPE